MRKSILFICLLLVLNQSFAQTFFIDQSQSQMSIRGTSTLHDWESVVEEFEGKAEYDRISFSAIDVKAKVKSIKSGKMVMDKKTYEAMKEEDFPYIFLNADRLPVEMGYATGLASFTIAGVTRDVPVKLLISGNTAPQVVGEIKLKMTDFDITPPVAVFGTIKTGDEITVVIDFTLTKGIN
jgi:hypothetical protein